jgi:hypothetical protein
MTNHDSSLEWRTHVQRHRLRKMIGYGDWMLLIAPWRRDGTIVFWSHFSRVCSSCKNKFAHYMTKCSLCGGELHDQTKPFQ